MKPNGNDRKISKNVTQAEAERMDLGTCCCCGGSDNVRNILTLNGWCPILGRGWGCTVCGLAPHGAVAVVCNACLPEYQAESKPLLWICTGRPARDGRTPIGERVAGFDHDLTKHIPRDGGF